MVIARRLLMEAARRLAANPEVQRKAETVATSAYRAAAPRLKGAGRHVAESFRETGAETPLLDDPVGFVKKFRRKLLPPEE